VTLVVRVQIAMTASAPRLREDPAADAARLLLRLGLALLTLGLPMLAFVSRRWVFILFPIGAALILLAAMLRRQDHARLRLANALRSRLGVAAVFLIGWTALSLIWTPFFPDASDHLMKAAGTGLLAAAMAAALPPLTRSSDLYLVPIGVAASAALALALGLRPAPAPPVDLDAGTMPRAIATLSVLVWPALGALGARQHWGQATLLMLSVAAAATLNWSPVILLALACGAIIFAVARSGLAQTCRALGVVAALVFLLAPLLPLAAQALFAARGVESAEIAQSAASWAAVIKADPARLLTGHGLDTAARSVQSGFLPASMPRSILFEIWHELGVLGALGMAALLYLCYDAAARAGPAAGPAFAGGLTACLALALMGQQTTQLWWLTALAAGLISVQLVARGQYRTTRPPARMSPSAEPPQ
jgi:hypothetical protein